jgi:hypothetical protein
MTMVLLVNWERLTEKRGQNMRVRMLEASDLPKKEYLPRSNRARSSKIPISVGRLPERLLYPILVHPNGEKTVFMWDDKPAAIGAWKERKHPSYLPSLTSLSTVNCPISVGMVPESWFASVVIRITKNGQYGDEWQRCCWWIESD